MSEKYRKTCKYLNFVENLIIVSWTVNGCVSISAFASLASIAVGIISSAVELNICEIIAAKKIKSIIKKKKKLS